MGLRLMLLVLLELRLVLLLLLLLKLRMLLLVDWAVLGLWLLGHGSRRRSHELCRRARRSAEIKMFAEESVWVGEGGCLRPERRRGAHELRGEIEPSVAEVQAFAERGHVVLGGRHVLEEGAQEFGVGLAEERRTGRVGCVEEAILVLVHRVWGGRCVLVREVGLASA